MRILLAFLVVAALAVTVALFARINAGYALFVAPPYRIDSITQLLKAKDNVFKCGLAFFGHAETDDVELSLSFARGNLCG